MSVPGADEATFAPRYRRIELALRARLASMAPHDALPSEAELCAEFSVSRMTARAAVTRLVEAGLAYRENGRGTFVAPAPSRRRAETLVGFSDEMRRRGRRPSSRVVHRLRRPATEDEMTGLQLQRPASPISPVADPGIGGDADRAPRSEVIALRRVRLADGVPVAIEDSTFPGSLEALLEADLQTGSLHRTLTDLGHIPTRGHATITADNATAEVSELLNCPTGSALLLECRIVLDQHHRPVELTVTRYLPALYGLEVSFDVTPYR